jgi:iron complex outermembrane receptor protein
MKLATTFCVHDKARPAADIRSLLHACAALLLLTGSHCVSAADTNNTARIPTDLTELNIEQLMKIEVGSVYSASKHEQKITEAPAAVTVITSDDIKKYGYRTLADILRSVPDFYVTYDRNYAYIGVRGFDRPGDFGGRTLILVDGHRINEPLYDSAFPTHDFILDVDLIDRVEIIRGPGSSLYGNNAFFAVINVITRRAGDFSGHGAEAAGSAGSFDSYEGRASYGKKFTNGVDVVFSATVFDSDGQDRLFYKEFDDPTTHNGIAHGLDGENSYSLFSHLGYRDISFQAAWVSREKQVPTASFGTIFNEHHPDFETLDQRGYAELKYTHEFDNQWGVMARVYYDYYHYGADYPLPNNTPPPDVIVNRDNNSAEWVGGEAQVTKTLFQRHRLTLGAEVREDYRLDLENYDVHPYALSQNAVRNTQSYALYLQDEYQILTNLILNAGVRYDYFYQFGSTTNPRLALIYNPWEKTTLKLVYGTAFRAPNANEVYYASPTTQEPNRDLKPETITTYEMIVQQSIGTHWQATASGFYYKINDLISETTDPANGLIQFKNVDQVEAKGASAQLEANWTNGWRGRLSYTFTDVTNIATGEPLSNSPRHLAKLNLVAPLWHDKLFAGLEAQYTSSRMTLDGNHVPDVYLLNFTLFTQKLIKGWEASASIYNLLDYRYSDPGAEEHVQDAIRQDGRTFRVKLTYRF